MLLEGERRLDRYFSGNTIEPVNREKWMKVIGCALLLVGGLGFLAPMLSATGILKLPSDVEWPVGSASGILVAKDGEHVVLVKAASRIQIYDPAWKFLRGWHINPGEKVFALRLGGETNIELFTVQSKQRFVYGLNGQLLSQDSYTPQQFSDSHNPGVSATIPTHWWLWMLTSPAHSWIVAALGGGLLFVAAWKAKPKPV